MVHSSVKLDTPCELINITPVNPLISKCQIKVCYVGEEANRNKSIITKETAMKMANSLPGSPIVGYYNNHNEDFEEHNRTITISNGQIKMEDATRPYGFVDLGAKVWFQKFLDDNENQHEYLMTEGYLWTGQYPEAKRILEKGNNQSMELDNETLNGTWTKDDNERPEFFIINEAIISKLCILGEDCEPCFEGSNITKVQFSFEDGFKEQLFSMMQELKELLNKGGTNVFTTYSVKVGDSLWSALYDHVHENYKIVRVCEDEGQKYAVLQDNEFGKYFSLNLSVNEDNTVSFAEEYKEIEYNLTDEQFNTSDIETFETEYKKVDEKSDKEDKEDKSSSSDSEENTEDTNSTKDQEKADSSEKSSDSADKKDASADEKADEKEDDKKKKFSLDEVNEYIALKDSYNELENKFSALSAEKASLEAELVSLREFKLNTERAQKENMINNTFYMLSDSDKEDVVKNIDSYSLDDIEAKLSILCVRNHVSFADNAPQEHMTYSLNGELYNDDTTPAWIKAVMDTAKTLN